MSVPLKVNAYMKIEYFDTNNIIQSSDLNYVPIAVSFPYKGALISKSIQKIHLAIDKLPENRSQSKIKVFDQIISVQID